MSAKGNAYNNAMAEAMGGTRPKLSFNLAALVEILATTPRQIKAAWRDYE